MLSANINIFNLSLTPTNINNLHLISFSMLTEGYTCKIVMWVFNLGPG